MNFSPLFLLAASRTPASSLGTRIRLCVRFVFRLLAFSLVRPLPSTSTSTSTSAAVAAVATLFGGFVGTMGLCDFPSSFVVGLQPGRSRRVPTVTCPPKTDPWGLKDGSGLPLQRKLP